LLRLLESADFDAIRDKEGSEPMKALFISFAVGLMVGLLYGIIRVKSPAPPIIALLGLLGMVLGEQFGGWILAKRINIAHAASVCLVSKHWDQRPNLGNTLPSVGSDQALSASGPSD
jgi:XapX domain-containing protein